MIRVMACGCLEFRICTRDSLMKHGFIQLEVYAPNMQTALRVDAIGEKVCFR